MNEQLIDFYCGEGTDTQGRTFGDILTFKNRDLERVHDYIQWLFPTVTPSMHSEDAPVLDDETIKALKSSPKFQLRFHTALTRIFSFWGIPYTTSHGQDGIRIEPILLIQNWMEAGDHNLLRMSRVMESCRLLGWPETAKSFHKELLACAERETRRSRFATAANCYYWFISAYGE